MNDSNSAWVVCWRFEAKTPSSFYNLLAALADEQELDELAPRAVWCPHDESAYLLRALVERLGGQVRAFAVNGRRLSDRDLSSRAHVRIRQIQADRLSRRGRHRAISTPTARRSPAG